VGSLKDQVVRDDALTAADVGFDAWQGSTHVIIQTILGHKVAAIGAVLVLGTTTAAAAATGNVPFVQEDEPAVEVQATDDEEEAEEAEDEVGTDSDAEAPAVEEETEAEDDSTDDAPIAEDEGSSDDDNGQKEEVLPPVDDEGNPYGLVLCEEAVNHGEYVSGVAHDNTIKGNRGQIVSQAARTSCGKDDGPGEPEAAEEEETKEADADDDAKSEEDREAEGHDDADDDHKDRPDRAERGHGNSGNGNGNGNGRGSKKD
jgi:hypothetical protein